MKYILLICLCLASCKEKNEVIQDGFKKILESCFKDLDNKENYSFKLKNDN